jgi:hypothetical protein
MSKKYSKEGWVRFKNEHPAPVSAINFNIRLALGEAGFAFGL